MKTGVIIGRFQIDSLHEGHISLIKHAMTYNNVLVILIGSAGTNFTDTDPLPFAVRKEMILLYYPEANVFEIKDHDEDDVWCEQVDELLKDYENVTLYGSRDSFIPCYNGKHKTEYFETPYPVHSSKDRRKEILNEKDLFKSWRFRAGLIYLSQARFPIVYPTADVAVIKYDRYIEPESILLGRKFKCKTYCLIGGFADKKDKSFDETGSRELLEEVYGIKTATELTYVGSHAVDDKRYRGTKDGITTTLFIADYHSGDLKAADDIAELKWFPLKKFDKSILDEKHHPLFDMVIKKLRQTFDSFQTHTE